MTPTELQEAREAIGWSRRQLADRTGRSASVIGQMEAAPGQTPVSVDPAVAEYVAKVREAINTVPLPVLERDRRHRRPVDAIDGEVATV